MVLAYLCVGTFLCLSFLFLASLLNGLGGALFVALPIGILNEMYQAGALSIFEGLLSRLVAGLFLALVTGVMIGGAFSLAWIINKGIDALTAIPAVYARAVERVTRVVSTVIEWVKRVVSSVINYFHTFPMQVVAASSVVAAAALIFIAIKVA